MQSERQKGIGLSQRRAVHVGLSRPARRQTRTNTQSQRLPDKENTHRGPSDNNTGAIDVDTSLLEASKTTNKGRRERITKPVQEIANTPDSPTNPNVFLARRANSRNEGEWPDKYNGRGGVMETPSRQAAELLQGISMSQLFTPLPRHDPPSLDMVHESTGINVEQRPQRKARKRLVPCPDPVASPIENEDYNIQSDKTRMTTNQSNINECTKEKSRDDECDQQQMTEADRTTTTNKNEQMDSIFASNQSASAILCSADDGWVMPDFSLGLSPAQPEPYVQPATSVSEIGKDQGDMIGRASINDEEQVVEGGEESEERGAGEAEGEDWGPGYDLWGSQLVDSQWFAQTDQVCEGGEVELEEEGGYVDEDSIMLVDTCKDTPNTSAHRHLRTPAHPTVSPPTNPQFTPIQLLRKSPANDSLARPPNKVKKGSVEIPDWLGETVSEGYRRAGLTRLYPWQAECLSMEGVADAGRNLLYSAPTSAGKTMVAEILLARRVAGRQCKGLFIVPFVSVATEKTAWLQSFLRPAGIRVVGFYANHTPMAFSEVDIAVCTIERANSLVNRLIDEKALDCLGLVVVDELHLAGDQQRGYLLELLLTKLRCGPKKPQLVGLSATLPNIKLLSDWLGAALYVTDYRPVPLAEYIKAGDVIMDTNLKPIRCLLDNPRVGTVYRQQGGGGGYVHAARDPDMIAPLCYETVSEGHSVLVFCPSKAQCVALADNLSDLLPSNLPSHTDPTVLLADLKATPAGLDPVLARTIPKGVAFHHAGLTLEERHIIEKGYHEGHIKVLTATSTLSSGVNLPARRVIFRSLRMGAGPLSPYEYCQMKGRAGRKGKDELGESFLVCRPNEKARAKGIAASQLMCISSCLGNGRGLTRAILESVVGGLVATMEEVHNFIGCTLLAAEKGSDNEPLRTSVDVAVRYLVDNEFVDSAQGDGGETMLRATRLGKATVTSSLPPEESLQVKADLQRAHRQLVLDTELHLLYLVTPLKTGVQPTWITLANQLSDPRTERVVKALGLEQKTIYDLVCGRDSREVKEQRMIGERLYVAVVLSDVVKEVSIGDAAAAYDINRGTLQALMHSAATFAGMVSVFCRHLGWANLELLLGQFQDRLAFGVERELCALTSIPGMLAPDARALYSKGHENVASVASADPKAVGDILWAATPFFSRTQGARAGSEDAQAQWVTRQRAKTQRRAAVLVHNANQLLRLQHPSGHMGTPNFLPPSAPLRALTNGTPANGKSGGGGRNASKTKMKGSVRSRLGSKEGVGTGVRRRDGRGGMERRERGLGGDIVLREVNLEDVNGEGIEGDSSGEERVARGKRPRKGDLIEDYLMENDEVEELATVRGKGQKRGESDVHDQMAALKAQIDQLQHMLLQQGEQGKTPNTDIGEEGKSDKRPGKRTREVDGSGGSESVHDGGDNKRTRTETTKSRKDDVIFKAPLPLKPRPARENENAPPVNEVARAHIEDDRDQIRKESRENEETGDMDDGDESLAQLRKRAIEQANGSNKTNRVRPGPQNVIDVTGVKEVFELFCEEMTQATELALCAHYVGVGDRRVGPDGVGPIVGVGVAWEASTVYYLRVGQGAEENVTRLAGYDVVPPEKAMDFLQKYMQTTTARLLVPDLKGLLRRLARIDAVPGGACEDPEVAMWMTDPDSTKKLCPARALQEAHPDWRWAPNVGSQRLADAALECCRVALATWACAPYLRRRLEADGMLDAFRNVEMPIMCILGRMEHDGMPVDMQALKGYKSVLLEQLRVLEDGAYRLAGKKFPLSNYAVLGQVLFERLKLPYPGPVKAPQKKAGPGGRQQKYSTNKDVLLRLTGPEATHPLPGIVLEWRAVTEIISRQITVVERCTVMDDRFDCRRVHATSKPHTSTGRVAVENPPLQNMPHEVVVRIPQESSRSKTITQDSQLVETRLPVNLRKVFRPPPHMNYVVVSADYSQLELRVIAHLSQDERLLHVLNKGGDVFRLIAAEWQRIEPKAVTDAQRAQAKQICYGMLYGIGDKGLGEKLGLDSDKATTFVESFKAHFAGVTRYMDKVVKAARANGYITTIGGRRRVLRGLNSRNQADASRASRQAINSTIQGSAADIVKMAMIAIDKEIAVKGPRGWNSCARVPRLLLQIHDELLFEVPAESLSEFAATLRTCMERSPIQLMVALPIKIHTGPSWGELQEYSGR